MVEEITVRERLSVFGAPISWVALFGALIGGTAIIPALFYTSGGGFTSVGMLIFAPLAGVILGPFAGFVSGLIGGIIGMFISPGAYPLGLVDAFLSGAFLPLSWGLAAMGKKGYKYFILWWIISGEIIYILFPYIWPGPQKLGTFGPWPSALPVLGTFLLGKVIHVHFWGPPLFMIANLFIEKWAKSDIKFRVLMYSLILNCAGRGSWLPIWVWPYDLVYVFPLEQYFLSAFFTSWIQFPFAIGIPTAVVAAAIVAMRRAGLRKIPNTCW